MKSVNYNPSPFEVDKQAPRNGKSFGCGLYLLYDAAKVLAVAYFVRGSAYLFHKTGVMTRRVVFYKKADNAVSACGTWRMGGKRR
ncbi:putative Retrotransposon hot spot protein [Trypanosoma vivax]|nr:putative Retrotransposon hot spot protein [Trypanosoma vivax]KAH8608397.1 putative Retrotransposon hot spot protein [Trypanosoma vivax]KAH8608425.1 putative Retrotransposon hot spot protein [Trypanosoma vivax]KAH8615520.1 putative Retrotransposon hot spot protein [Trypanosoma vivax]